MTAAAPPKRAGRVQQARALPPRPQKRGRGVQKSAGGGQGGKASPPLHPVSAYARAVVDGQFVAGKLVILACRRHLRDLRESRRRSGARASSDSAYYFDEEAASDAIDFFANLRQSKGRWGRGHGGLGDPLVLQPWQAFVIGCIFGWKIAGGPRGPGTGLRRFRTAYVSVARKNGKTTLAAGVALYLLDFDGEPGAEVYAAATKRDQARLCWTEASRMVAKTPALKRRIRIIESRANMHVVETASKFEALGADVSNLDGLNTHGCIIDELHAHKTRGVVDVMEGSTGAREQPLFFYITTAGLERASIYAETDDYARRVLEGAVEDETLFAYVATLDKDDDWQDPKTWPKANPSLGVTLKLEDLIVERDKALAAPGKRNAFCRDRTNTRTGQFEAWFTPEQVDANRHEFDERDLEGWRCYAMLDLASRIDIATLVLWFPDEEEGGGWMLPYFWVPADASSRRWERDAVPYPEWIEAGYLRATEGNVIDYDVIREDIRELASRYQFAEIGFDPWNATQLITQLQEDGATCVQISQTIGSLSPGAKELEALIAGGKARHDGNPVLRWMLLNAQKKTDEAGNIRPDRKRSADKIDAVVCLVMGLTRVIATAGDGPGGISLYVPGEEEPPEPPARS